MITVSGAVSRSYLFPADPATALMFYSNVERTLRYLSHISLLTNSMSEKHRLEFHSIELGFYQVRIICDVKYISDPKRMILTVQPVEPTSKAPPNAGLYSTSNQGIYASQSSFVKEGNQTRIYYSIRISASLPVPLGLRLMPLSVVNTLARAITKTRMEEIVEGLIRKSLRAAQQELHLPGNFQYSKPVFLD
jgi:hypothetical protein